MPGGATVTEFFTGEDRVALGKAHRESIVEDFPGATLAIGAGQARARGIPP